MNHYLVSTFFGFIGGSIPGVHVAWKFRRSARVRSGNIDLTYRKKRP